MTLSFSCLLAVSKKIKGEGELCMNPNVRVPEILSTCLCIMIFSVISPFSFSGVSFMLGLFLSVGNAYQDLFHAKWNFVGLSGLLC